MAKILIVDDSKLNLKYASDILRDNQINCDIVLAGSGEKALEILNDTEIDIILLDIVMPGIMGLDVLKRIKEDKTLENTYVIMLTSITDKNVLKQSFELGANDYINKPIETIEFISRIKVAMRDMSQKNSLIKASNMMEVQNEQLKKINRKLTDTQFFIIQKEKMIAIGQLAAGIAHEVNNPLGFVSSNLETLKNYLNKIQRVFTKYQELKEIAYKNSENKPLIDMANEIDKLEESSKIRFAMNDLDELIAESSIGIQRVSKIVQSLRNFSRMPKDEDIDYNSIDTIIEEVLMIVKSEAKQVAEINLELSELPAIRCNRGQIGQVLLNIIINAIHAIKSQKRNQMGKILIKTYREKDYDICEVADDGPGIEPEIANKIFDPFFTTKDVGEGTGLGLSISYDIIVSKHNGQLLVNSKKSNGTVFTIKLPIVSNMND